MRKFLIAMFAVFALVLTASLPSLADSHEPGNDTNGVVNGDDNGTNGDDPNGDNGTNGDIDGGDPNGDTDDNGTNGDDNGNGTNGDDNGNGDDTNGNGDENGSECIDLNTASQEELLELNQVGEARAPLIIGLRPIESLDDLKQIAGFNGTGQNFAALLGGDPAPCPIESDEEEEEDDTDDDTDDDDSDDDESTDIPTPTVIDTGR